MKRPTAEFTPVRGIIIAIPLLLLVLYYLFGIHLAFNPEARELVFTKMTIVKKELLDGQFPLWNPYAASGTVLFAQGHLPLPECLALFFLPVKDTIVLAGVVHVLLGLTAFYLFAQAVDLSARAALLGAVIWVFNGYHAYTLHELVIYGAFLPFMLFCYMRFSREGGNKIWLVVAGGWKGDRVCGGNGRPWHLACGVFPFAVCGKLAKVNQIPGKP